MRMILLPVAFTAMAGECFAACSTTQDQRDIAFRDAYEASLKYLQLSLICEPAVGSGYFQIARSAMEHVLISDGASPSTAVIKVGEVVARQRTDAAELPSGLGVGATNEEVARVCADWLPPLAERTRLETAKLRIASCLP